MSHVKRVAWGRAFVFALAAGLISFASIVSTAAQDWTLGQQRFSTNAGLAARPLQIRSSGRSNLVAFKFVGRVGGVSFETTAEPDQTLRGKSIEISYNPSHPDGSRLVVRAGTTLLRTNIPDWQLRPIANFADSEYNAIISLFGEGPDRNSYYYIQYHDSLKDTLLGMRLLQADILFMSLGEHWRMPRYAGKVILGPGEQETAEERAIRAARRLDAALRGQKWRSWVLTDAGTHPTFGVVQGELIIRVRPYYYFWNIEQTEYDSRIKEHNRLVHEYNALLASAKADLDRHNSLVPIFNATTDPQRKRQLRAQLDALKSEIDSKEARITALRAQIDADQPEPKVFEVIALTNAMRSLDGALAEYNPSVYKAYQRLAQYGAFFRYVKNTNPANWKTFQQRLTSVAIVPAVKTPTTWERHHNR
jgi:hypothetical protein